MTGAITLPTRAGPVHVRPETSDDQPFLYELFRGHVTAELAGLLLDPSTREGLIRMQFAAQTKSYRAGFPDARFDILERAGAPVGRMVVDAGNATEPACIVDFALLPACRGQGLGSAILAAVLDRLAPAGRPVRCKVLAHNEPSIRMCRRVGFTEIGQVLPFLQLEWRPDIKLGA